MEGDILKFLYEFYERGDYPHKSLFDILDKLPTKWSDQKSIDDLKERIARLKSGGLIEGDWSDDGFKSWGQIVEDKSFTYRNHPLNARLTDKGAELVERRLEKERQKRVDTSTLETARLTRRNIRIGWVFASATFLVIATNLIVTLSKGCKEDKKERDHSTQILENRKDSIQGSSSLPYNQTLVSSVDSLSKTRADTTTATPNE